MIHQTATRPRSPASNPPSLPHLYAYERPPSSETPEVPRECPMCSLANSGGDEECRTCGSALPLDSTSDGDNCPRRESARAASSQTQQLPPGESVATAGASLEGTEDSVYLKELAEAQRESAALAGDLEKRAAEWKQQLENACYLSKQNTAVYRGRGESARRPLR